MAFLNYEDDQYRETWLKYAIEFARRGLWPAGEIEAHGPHGAPADCLWGSAEVETADDGFQVEFITPHGIRRYWDVRELRVKCGDETFPVLPKRKLPDWLRENLELAEQELQAIQVRERTFRRSLQRR